MCSELMLEAREVPGVPPTGGSARCTLHSSEGPIEGLLMANLLSCGTWWDCGAPQSPVACMQLPATCNPFLAGRARPCAYTYGTHTSYS